MSTEPRVLIVDTFESNTRILSNIFEKMGYQVALCLEPDEALEQARDFNPVAVLVNFTLEGSTGLSVLQQFKFDSSSLSGAIVAMISETYDEGERIAAVSMGADAFFGKPFNTANISLTIGNLITLHSYRQMVQRLNEELVAQKVAVAEDRKKLGKYISAPLIEAILSGAVKPEVGGKIVRGSILFLYLRNATPLVHDLNKKRISIAEHLSAYFQDIFDIIEGVGGTVNNFRGEALLAVFNLPLELEQFEQAAVLAATRVEKHTAAYNEFTDELDFSIGMGIATGPVYAGNIGSQNRLDYTVLGDPANLASRLASLTNDTDADVLIDEETLKGLDASITTQKLDLQNVRGKINKVSIYAVT